MRIVNPQRDAFIKEFPACWVCFSQWRVWVHEFIRGGSRGVALDNRCCWFAACWECNSGCLDDASQWPVERQLAVKFLMDPDYFDLEKCCELKRVGPECYTMDDLKPYIEAERIRLF